MKNGAPKRLKPKSQRARLMVMSSGGLSFFLFLQQTNNTMPFPSTDMTPAERVRVKKKGDKILQELQNVNFVHLNTVTLNVVFNSWKHELSMIVHEVGFRVNQCSYAPIFFLITHQSASLQSPEHSFCPTGSKSTQAKPNAN